MAGRAQRIGSTVTGAFERARKAEAELLAVSPTGGPPGIGVFAGTGRAPAGGRDGARASLLRLALSQVTAAPPLDASVPTASQLRGGVLAKTVLGKALSWYVGYVAGQVGEFQTAVTRAVGLLGERVQVLDGLVQTAFDPSNRFETVAGLNTGPAMDGRWWTEAAMEAVGGPEGRVAVLGCGAGPLVEMLRSEGADAYGVEPGGGGSGGVDGYGEVDVREGDPLVHLRDAGTSSLSGVVVAGVAEYLAVGECRELAELLGDRVSPGGVAVLVSPTPAAWADGGGGVAGDLAPGRPLLAETWEYLLTKAGLACRVVQGPASYCVIADRPDPASS